MRIVGGRPVAIRIERPGGVRAGAVMDGARLVKKLAHRGLVALPEGQEGMLAPLPDSLSEGQTTRVEVMREPMREQGRAKMLRVRPSGAVPAAGPSLRARIAADAPVREVRAAEGETLDDHDWNELIEQARQGVRPFTGGSLLIEPTAAFTAIDVDGDLPARDLAFAAAPEVAHAIALFDLQGNIVVDFPTLPDKADRVRIGDLFDAAVGFACERTAVNGFGLMQIVLRRTRASTIELLQGQSVCGATLALLRRAERSRGRGWLTLRAHPAVIARLEKKEALAEELSQRTGRPVILRADPKCPIDGGEPINEVEA